MDRAADMPIGLEAVEVPPEAGDMPVPRYVDAFIRDAEDRAEEYGERIGKGLFSPGDARCAFLTIQWLLRKGLLGKGAKFLEWGSGQGMVSILASFLGCEAVGVEIDKRLAAESAEMAARYGSRARFIHGSYDPSAPGMEVATAEGRDAVYVYPWPGEEGYFLRLFAATAKSGALLLMNLGPEDIRAYRKKAG